MKNEYDSDYVQIECTDWSNDIEDKRNWRDNFNVTVATKEINDWMASGYN